MAQTPNFLLLHLLLLHLLFHISSSNPIQFTTQQQLKQQLLAAEEANRAELQHLLQTSSLCPADAAALLGIKTTLRDLPGSDFFSKWDFNSSSNPCSFTGVLCSLPSNTTPPALLRVTSLALGTGLADSPGLAGTLPPSLTNLTALTQFILFAGRVSGTIPYNLGDALPDLRFLSITNNLISGPIPASLSRLQNLHTLDLGHNHLFGSIPPPLCSLPNLKILILASNGYLSGTVPDITSALLHLDLRENSFSGQLPALPTTLRFLSASTNDFSGTVDAVSHLPDLTFLDLAANAFTGPIPPSLFSPSVPLLLLQRNNLSGKMPPGRSTSSATSDGGWTVDLSHNMLTGEVTPVLAGAESVYLNHNSFVGAVPSEYAKSVYAGKMRTFYAQHNFLTGFDFPLPPGSAPLPASVSVCLAYNCMAPPPLGPTGCPANAGEGGVPRPASQCPAFNNGTTTAGGGGGP